MARWGLVGLGTVPALWLAVTGTAWALPSHDYKHDYQKHGYEYGDTDKHQKPDKYGKLSSYFDKEYGLSNAWWGKWEKHKEYDGHDLKKWAKGSGQYDPDCDPPVASPEPATLLLLGATLAGVGVYSRRRRQPATGTAPNHG
jgi:hypothetical protein